MGAVTVRNINARKADLPAPGVGAVPWHGWVEVDADVAGRPPKGDPGKPGYDQGSGLLALPLLWEPYKPTADERKAAVRTVETEEVAE